MTTFRYRVVDERGRPSNGSLEAVDRSSAINLLRDRGLTLVEVMEQTRPPFGFQFVGVTAARRRLSGRDLAFIARQMSNLLQAGSELDRSLIIVAGLVSRGATRDVIADLAQQLRRGRSLAEALAAAVGLFPDFFISMVRAGEGAGALAPAFRRLAEILDRQEQTRTKLISALIYPAILLFSTLASIVLIMTVVVPQFEPIFEQARQELPLLTRVVILLSRATTQLLPILLPFLLIAAIGTTAWPKNPSSRLKLHRAILRLPLIGAAVLKAEMARLAYTLGALLQGGIPLIRALTIAQSSVANLHLRAALAEVREGVKDGLNIAAALKRQAVFPELFVQLTAVAEESAKLGETLLEIGRIYDEETATTMHRLVAVATPAATILLGGMVALVLAAILLAVLKMNELAI
jgi:general secretion pathway protein F